MGFPMLDFGMLWVMVTERPLLVLQAVILGIVFYGLIYSVFNYFVRRFEKFPSQYAITMFWGAVAALMLLIVAIYGFIGAKIGAGISLVFFGLSLYHSLEFKKNEKKEEPNHD